MNNPKNALLVELYDLAITPGSNKRFGKVLTKKFLKEDDLIKIAVSRRTELNPSTLRAAIDILQEIAMDELLNGASVNFGPGIFKLAVNGAFTTEEPEWNSEEHKVVLQVTPTAQLYQMMEKVEVKVRGMAPVSTCINTVRELPNGKINASITRGNAVELQGVKLKIAGDNPANGITLTNTVSGEITVIPDGRMVENLPKKIIFIVPETLEPGDYQLTLTTQFSNGSTLTKQPRCCQFNTILKVN
jgi:hypothetical protein